MTEKNAALVEIEIAFSDVPKPEHFLNHTHCQDCAEHDALLRMRNRDTLKIEDVGNISWQPISSCSPEGMAYYMPALARLAFDEPTYNYGWYGDVLHIHLSYNGPDNEFLKYCNPTQRRAVAQLLLELSTTFSSYEMRLTEAAEFESCANDWSS